jgi:hypothetical protein
VCSEAEGAWCAGLVLDHLRAITGREVRHSHQHALVWAVREEVTTRRAPLRSCSALQTQFPLWIAFRQFNTRVAGFSRN